MQFKYFMGLDRDSASKQNNLQIGDRWNKIMYVISLFNDYDADI